MKKLHLRVVFFVIILLIVIYMTLPSVSIFKSRDRSLEEMELIAEKGFNDLIYDDKITDKIPSFKKLSLEESEEKEVLIFSWFYILESGDSAKLFVEVDKKGKFWENDPSRISTNSKWSYMFSPTSQFMSLIPQMMDISYLDKVNSVKVLGESFQDMDSSKLFLSEEKLFFILKEGYLSPLRKVFSLFNHLIINYISCLFIILLVFLGE